MKREGFYMRKKLGSFRKRVLQRERCDVDIVFFLKRCDNLVPYISVQCFGDNIYAECFYFLCFRKRFSKCIPYIKSAPDNSYNARCSRGNIDTVEK